LAADVRLGRLGASQEMFAHEWAGPEPKSLLKAGKGSRRLHKGGDVKGRVLRLRVVASPLRRQEGFLGKEIAVATNVLREVATDDSPLNAAELLERVDGDRELLQELLELFRDDWRRQIEALREAVAAVDGKGVLAAGHALKGMLANLTATKAAAMAGAVEMAGRRSDCGSAGAQVAELEREILRAESALEGMCTRVKQ